MTLHRLLKTHPGNRTRFRHHRGNRLPHDLVVVDETSMVSLTMMARLLEAVRPDARLVFVGDPDQLSSVDAGAVLTDLVRGFEGRPDSPVAALHQTHRYGEEIRALAEALRLGDADAAIEALRAGHEHVEWITDLDPASAIRATALPAALAVRDAAAAGDGAKALAALDRHRLLCAHRDGPFGVRHWNRRIEQWLTQETGDPLYESAYLGRPVLVTANDYTLGIYNGDTGVVVDTPGRSPGRGVDQHRRPRARAVAARRRRDPARDDDPQEPGQPGRRGDGAAARRGVATADARAVLHRGDPRRDQGPRHRSRGGRARRHRPAGPASERAAGTSGGRKHRRNTATD